MSLKQWIMNDIHDPLKLWTKLGMISSIIKDSYIDMGCFRLYGNLYLLFAKDSKAGRSTYGYDISLILNKLSIPVINSHITYNALEKLILKHEINLWICDDEDETFYEALHFMSMIYRVPASISIMTYKCAEECERPSICLMIYNPLCSRNMSEWIRNKFIEIYDSVSNHEYINETEEIIAELNHLKKEHIYRFCTESLEYFNDIYIEYGPRKSDNILKVSMILASVEDSEYISKNNLEVSAELVLYHTGELK